MVSIFSTEDRFKRNVPMILRNDSLRQDVYKRLQKFRVPFGWKKIPYEGNVIFYESITENKIDRNF